MKDIHYRYCYHGECSMYGVLIKANGRTTCMECYHPTVACYATQSLVWLNCTNKNCQYQNEPIGMEKAIYDSRKHPVCCHDCNAPYILLLGDPVYTYCVNNECPEFHMYHTWARNIYDTLLKSTGARLTCERCGGPQLEHAAPIEQNTENVPVAKVITVVREGDSITAYNVPAGITVNIIELDICSDLAVAMMPEFMRQYMEDFQEEPDFTLSLKWVRAWLSNNDNDCSVLLDNLPGLFLQAGKQS